MAEAWIRRSADELARLREMFIQRAALERYALREATEELQTASDGIVRAGHIAVNLARRFWLPLSALVIAGLRKRLGPALRLARAGLTVWQITRLLRAPHRD